MGQPAYSTGLRDCRKTFCLLDKTARSGGSLLAGSARRHAQTCAEVESWKTLMIKGDKEVSRS